jgi:enoyl-CoA hydratase
MRRAEGTSYLAANREAIDRCFSAGSVEEIIQRLRVEDSPFGHETLKTLQSKSPTSLKVILVTIHRRSFRYIR